jgi:hypothetical protein
MFPVLRIVQRLDPRALPMNVNEMFSCNIPFPIKEHEAIVSWMKHYKQCNVRIELALNYPEVTEMMGIIENGFETPTFFMWRTEKSVKIMSFSGADKLECSNVADFLIILEKWIFYLNNGGKIKISDIKVC